MMSAMDDAIGAVTGKLRETGQEENTLIFFFSDNGGPTLPTTTVNGAVNHPLRGSKRQTLEGGIRVPFLASWKGRLPAGKSYDHPVIQLDVLPTALAAAGIETSTDARFDGVNLLPYLTGEKAGPPHETLYWRFGEQMAIRRGDWKLVRYGDNATIDTNESWPKLYNLAQDIGEASDLAASNPEKVKELESAWQSWNAELARPLWGGQGNQKAGKNRKKRDRAG
jgi:arylsulfatase A-like enzyme